MTMLQTIILSLLITYLIVSTILGNNKLLSLILSFYNYIKVRIYINKLERLNYFEYNNEFEKKEFTRIIKSELIYNSERFSTLINYFSFKIDRRNYLVDFDCDKIIVDKIGIDDKWCGLLIRQNSELTDFLNFTSELGLEIEISEIVYLDEFENNFRIDLKVNQKKYSIHQNYDGDDYSKEIIYDFVAIINSELLKINSKEKIYFVEYYADIMIIFLNNKIYNYLIKISKTKQKPIMPNEWKNTFLENSNSTKMNPQ